MVAQSRPLDGYGVLRMDEAEIRELIKGLRELPSIVEPGYLGDEDLELLRKAANQLEEFLND